MGEETTLTTIEVITQSLIISGKITLFPGSRLTDYIDEAKNFFPITEAYVKERTTGKILYKDIFLNVNKAGIEIVLPKDNLS